MRLPRSSPLAPALAGTLLLGALAACAPPAPPPPPAPVSDVTAVVGATLWDGTGAPALEQSVVLVRQGRITCAGTVEACPVPVGATRVDAAGRFLIPGLIDPHVHLLFVRQGSTAPDFAADLRDLVAQGITTVRDMGTDVPTLLRLVQAQPVAPRVYAMQLVAGRKFFYGREPVRLEDGATAWRMPPAEAMFARGWRPWLVGRDEDADSIAVRARRAGAIGLKLYGFLDDTMATRLGAAARRHGLTAWAHAWIQPAGPDDLVDAGMNGLVHAALFVGDFIGPLERRQLLATTDILDATIRTATAAGARDPAIGETLDRMARKGIMLEPTLDVTLRSATFLHGRAAMPTLQDRYARAAAGFAVALAREARSRGVVLIPGSDHVAYGPVEERASFLSELTLFVDSVGYTPREALLAATRDAARALGSQQAMDVGTIEPGKHADLVLLQADPLRDVRHLEQVEWVMLGGKVLQPWSLRTGVAMR